jgi:ectoine hydroxylase-related dioxygenase (phytanoyl-CoA dioxygenase family)
MHNELIDGSGYFLAKNFISEELIDNVVNRLDEISPVRASSSTMQYAEKEDIKNLPDIAVWWSQTVINWPEVLEIEKLLNPLIKNYLPNAEFYSSDIVVIEKESIWLNPHIDTPHRFKKYNYDKRLLGIQCIISLTDIDKNSASTGLVPQSQLKDFNINLCYEGLYNDFFLEHSIQPNMPKGTVLLYNCRVLHSSMPNPLPKSRPALLLHYLDNDIIEDVRNIDNIWKSNQ